MDYPNGIDGFDTIVLWVKDWLLKHSMNGTAEEEWMKNKITNAKTPYEQLIIYLEYILNNLVKMENLMLMVGFIGLALGSMLISIYFLSSYLFGFLILICCEVFLFFFILDKRSIISMEVSSSLLFLAMNIILYIFDLYLFYHTNPYNQGWPITAYLYSAAAVIVAILAFIIFLSMAYSSLYSRYKKKIMREQSSGQLETKKA